MRSVSLVALTVALLLGLSVTAVVAMQDWTGGSRDKEASKPAAHGHEPAVPDQQPVVEDPNVKFIGEFTPQDAPALKDQPIMIDVALASIEIGPQAERCGSESVPKETLKAIVRQYLALNKSTIKTQQVSEGDSLTVMACVYPNDFYPGQAVLSVAVPQRLTQPIFIPVSEDCVRRVNEAIAARRSIPEDCKPTQPPVEPPETLLIPVPLAEVAQ